MQVLKEPLFYSSIRSGLDGEVEDDRELLLQEQKSCRTLARKFSLETNRRRKALDERRKQLDIQEQILREKILQQRKQRLQEATERFQRAHLPPSQKRSAASSKRAIDLDEALSNIHGALSSYARQSSFLSSASNLSRSGSPLPRPPGGSSGSHKLGALSAADAYAKLMLERNLSDCKPRQPLFLNQLQEAEAPLKVPKQAHVQEHHDAVFSCTESLSSLDSLEPTPEVQGDNPTCWSSSSLGLPEVQDAKRSSSPQGRLDCPPSTRPSILEEVLSQQDNPSSSALLPALSDNDSSDEEQSVQDLTHAVEQCNLVEPCQGPLMQAAPGCHQDLAAISGHITSCFGRAAQENLARDANSATCKTQTIPDTTPLEFSRLIQVFGSSLLKAPERKHVKHPPEMDAACRFGKKEDLFWVSSSNSADPNAASAGNPPLQKVASDGSFQSQSSVPNGDGIIPKREARPERYVERCKRGGPLVPPYESNDGRVATAPIPNYSHTTEEPERILPEPVASQPPPQIGDARFLKGILKKQSKYVAGNVKFSYRPGHFVFTRQVAMSIRDSMELARAKVREQDGNKGTKKKLRWFDEVNGDKEENEGRVKKNMNKPPPLESQLSHQPQPPFADDLQGPYVSAYENVPATIPDTSMTSTGPGSTRHAWADARSQEGRQQEQEESRPQTAVPRAAATRVPRRVRSGHICSRARRGIIIKPQSTSEARHLFTAQGVTMVPRPPPRSEVAEDGSNNASIGITRTAYKEDYPVGKPGLATEETGCKDNSCSQPLPLRHVLQSEESTLFTASPSYAYTYETVAKGVYALFQSNAQEGSARTGPPCGENAICLDRTPTDEEISLLWHGVRSALASKDGEPQSFLTSGSLSASPQACANLSNVTTNGIKAVTRMGGVLLTPSNTRSLVRRPTMENNIVKSRAYVDHGRIQAVAPGERCKSQSFNQASVPISGYKTDQTLHEKVIMESDGHVTLDMAPPQRVAGMVQQQRRQAFGLSALSLEEQRLLQSLDRLNMRLQNVQDVAMGNSALKAAFALDPVYNQSPQPGEALGVTLRRYHVDSADSRSRSHRRY